MALKTILNLIKKIIKHKEQKVQESEIKRDMGKEINAIFEQLQNPNFKKKIMSKEYLQEFFIIHSRALDDVLNEKPILLVRSSPLSFAQKFQLMIVPVVNHFRHFFSELPKLENICEEKKKIFSEYFFNRVRIRIVQAMLDIENDEIVGWQLFSNKNLQ